MMGKPVGLICVMPGVLKTNDVVSRKVALAIAAPNADTTGSSNSCRYSKERFANTSERWTTPAILSILLRAHQDRAASRRYSEKAVEQDHDVSSLDHIGSASSCHPYRDTTACADVDSPANTVCVCSRASVARSTGSKPSGASTCRDRIAANIGPTREKT